MDVADFARSHLEGRPYLAPAETEGAASLGGQEQQQQQQEGQAAEGKEEQQAAAAGADGEDHRWRGYWDQQREEEDEW